MRRRKIHQRLSTIRNTYKEIIVHSPHRSESAEIVESLNHYRDPFIYYEDGTYYIYGTDYGSNRHCLFSSSLYGTWEKSQHWLEERPEDLLGSLDAFSAPDFFKYKDSYYLFINYALDYC